MKGTHFYLVGSFYFAPGEVDALRVGLINMEPQYINIAIEKLRLFHQCSGDSVEDYMPESRDCYDKIYCSSIFSFTDKTQVPTDAVCGGTGFDITSRLPPEVEEMKPKLNIGFTTRGCIRNCGFCVVPKKEGAIRAVGDIYDFWDGVSKKIIILDNNLTALPEQFYKICGQIRKENLKVDYNQGLDIRLITKEMTRELASIKHEEYHFAFDYPGLEPVIREKTATLIGNGIKRSTFYVLVGYNTTIQEDLHRLRVLRELKQNAYVMRYKRERVYIPIARWANNHSWFQAISFEDFLKRPENEKAYRDLIELYI